jgi:transcription elongation factor Elf1
MATATRKATFALSCPECSASEVITINLNDLFGPITCDACGEQFTAAEARANVAEQLARWDAVCRWLEMAGSVIAK